MKTPKTKTVFRFWAGNVIAIFPALPAGQDAAYCLSYEHNGQHGACDPDMIIRESRPATREERAGLLQELQRVGYAVAIGERITQTDFWARCEEMRRAKAKAAAKPANPVAVNAARIAYECAQAGSELGTTDFDDIAAAAEALDRIESAPGFDWEAVRMDWESVCARIAAQIPHASREFLNAGGWAPFIKKLL